MRLKKIFLTIICTFLIGCSYNPFSKNIVLPQSSKVVANAKNEEKFMSESSLTEEGINKDNEKPIATKGEILKKFKDLNILKGSNWSFYAIDLDTDEIIANYQEEKAVIPASVYKLLTSITALEVMGKDTQIETKLGYTGSIENGVLRGDLIIVGGGDPTLGSELLKDKKYEFLEIWSDTLRNIGVKSIEGDILVKDNLFGYEGVSNKWQLEDLGSNYGQGVYGISIFDNLYDIYLDTSQDEKKPKITSITPKIQGLTITNNAIVNSRRGRNDFVMRGLPFENKRELRGEFVKSNITYKIQSDIPNPGLFLGKFLADYLNKNEIEFKGRVLTSRDVNIQTKGMNLVSIIKSPPISEIVKWLLHKSDNHYAESLYKHLTQNYKINIYDYWKNKGFDMNAVTVIDGCGLSRSNTLSTKFLVELLKYKNKEIKSLLPIAGVNGNIFQFLKNSSLQGKAFLKTGSMGGIQAYTGFIENNGKKYAFSIIINHWNGSRTKLNKEIERLLINLFQ